MTNSQSHTTAPTGPIATTRYMGITYKEEEIPGRLVLQPKGLVYYPGSKQGKKIKIFWTSVSNHYKCDQSSIEVFHKTKQASVLFRMDDKENLKRLKHDIKQRLRSKASKKIINGTAPLKASHDSCTTATSHDSFTFRSATSQNSIVPSFREEIILAVTSRLEKRMNVYQTI